MKFVKLIWNLKSTRIGFIACGVMTSAFIPFGVGFLIYYLTSNDFWTDFFLIDGLIIAWIGCFFLTVYVVKMVTEMIFSLTNSK